MSVCVICSENTKKTINNTKFHVCNYCFEDFFFKCSKCSKETPRYLMVNKYMLVQVPLNEIGLNSGAFCQGCANKMIDDYLDNNDIINCENCMCITSFKSDKGNFCKSCHDRIGPCIVCNNITTNKINFENKKANMCKGCANSKKILHCGSCGTFLFFDPKKKYRENRVICKRCKGSYSNCFKCGNLRDRRNVKDNICSACRGSLVECKGCKKLFYSTNAINIEGSYYCRKCAAEKGIVDLKRFNYKPPCQNFHGNSTENLYFGFENETVVKGKNNGKTMKELSKIIRHFDENLIYAKFDGSIGGQDEDHGEYGFEIVTHPMTFEFFNKYPNWDKLFTKETTVDNTCGMHIHISRGAFTTFHMFKFISFIHENELFTDYIAERKPNQYTKNLIGKEIIKDSKIGKKNRGPGDMYRRVKVNLCNSFTIELRFFANVNDTHKLKKNMEFTHALYSFTKNYPKSYAVDLDYFLEFVNKYVKLYPNLNKFIEENSFEDYYKKNKTNNDIKPQREEINFNDTLNETLDQPQTIPPGNAETRTALWTIDEVDLEPPAQETRTIRQNIDGQFGAEIDPWAVQ